MTQEEIRQFVAESLILDPERVKIETVSPCYLKITVQVRHPALIDMVQRELREELPPWMDCYVVPEPRA